ncbi:MULTISPECIES: hypothetical protein [Pseudovibrio]|uniref:hypothetical protein n=1 Tax=Stappiaceae TaxID=2821832 RepID=UPI002365C9B2|nr:MULTISPECIES: hypothetical protein [Pseudovibrio]MDD7908464.1 hypothetical protein [Pseudovibrio exalbescens]MDX5592664.1 hypothetical protein [Pseudovibrio sp. SPO723]
MNIVETADMWVISAKKRLCIHDIKDVSPGLTAQIEAEIDRFGLEVAGPWVFISHNLPENGRELFDWEMCRPIRKPARYDGALTVRRLEPVMAASTRYQGTMQGLFTKGYGPLLKDISFSRHVISGESREVYHSWSGQKGPYHEIEIQFVLSY